MKENGGQGDAANAGTPGDYSESVYRFYLELADRGADARRLIEAFLPPPHAARIRDMDHGFEFEMPIQCAPDLVRSLSDSNIAIYQLVRVSRRHTLWR